MRKQWAYFHIIDNFYFSIKFYFIFFSISGFVREERSCLNTTRKDKVVNLVTFQLRDSLFLVSTDFT